MTTTEKIANAKKGLMN